ncbi:50S ribosomal protein L14 [Candidatus Dojkabacteria bacterium]|uniref:Large ribosomal subunit protein uL14 n=1 Tax=Candidatus Dojkabacteria bacterium TaxID=2099670 RepID=A0A847VDL0_9BACT|nr:50S ribosomal protein L14 [Candidatus Dojkabacteria bacterium]
MLQKETNIIIADNSGAKVAKIIGIPGYSRIRYASLGQIVRVSIQKAIPRSAVKRHEVLNAVIVRVQKEHKRKDGSYIRFDDNAGVIIDSKKNLRGTRIFGPVARELKEKGFDKIVSLAPEVL